MSCHPISLLSNGFSRPRADPIKLVVQTDIREPWLSLSGPSSFDTSDLHGKPGVGAVLFGPLQLIASKLPIRRRRARQWRRDRVPSHTDNSHHHRLGAVAWPIIRGALVQPSLPAGKCISTD